MRSNVTQLEVKPIITPIIEEKSFIKKGWTEILKRTQQSTRLDIADFITDYVLPVIFCVFTVAYFVVLLN